MIYLFDRSEIWGKYKMKEKSLAKNAIWNGIKTVVTMAFPVVTFMYSSRILLTDGVGKINFAKSFTAYFTMLAMLGVVNYGTKEASKIKTNKIALSRFVHEILFINIVTTIVTYVLFLIIIHSYSLSSYRTLLLINSITIILTPLGMDWLYNALEEYEFITIRTCIVQGIGLICIFLFVHSTEDIYIYAFIQTLAGTGTNIVNFVHSGRLVTYKKLGGYNIRRHIKPLMLVFEMTVFIQIIIHLDTTMVGFMAGNDAVGLYTAANKMSSIVASLITSVVMVFMPRLAIYSSKGNREEIEKLSYQAINCVWMVGIPAALGVFLLSSPIITLFSGTEFIGAVATSQILAWRIFLVPLNSFIVLYLFIPINREKWNLVSTGCGMVINFLMNLYLIPDLQQNGAAVATIITEMLELCINFVYLKKIMSIKEIKKYLWQYLAGCLYMIVAYLLISRCIENMYLLMIATVLVCSVGYFSILYCLKNPYLIYFLNFMNRKRV